MWKDERKTDEIQQKKL